MATDLSCQQFLKMRADWCNPCLIHRHQEAKHFGRLPFFYRDQSLSAHRCRWSLGSRPAWRSGPFAQGWPGWAVWAGTSPNGDPKALACRGARILAKQHKAQAEKEAASTMAMAMAMAMRERGTGESHKRIDETFTFIYVQIEGGRKDKRCFAINPRKRWEFRVDAVHNEKGGKKKKGKVRVQASKEGENKQKRSVIYMHIAQIIWIN